MSIFKFVAVFLLICSFAQAAEKTTRFEVKVCSISFEYNGEIYFCGVHRRLGNELFRSNGTTEGTYVVADIDVGPGGSTPQDFFILRDKLYFTAETASNGREIWRTDGTKEGTKKISNAYPGPAGFPTIYELIPGDNAAYLSTVDGLWRTDGSQAGTQIILPPESFTIIASMNDTLYFSNKHSYVLEADGEAKIYKMEESSSQKELVANFGPNCTYNSAISDISTYDRNVKNNRFYFNLDCPGLPQPTLYVVASDGSTAGTKKVIDGRSSFLGDTNANRYYYNQSIEQIQYTDGVTTGTLEICGVKTTVCSSGRAGYGFPDPVNGKFIFSLAGSGGRYDIWSSNGTFGGTSYLGNGNLNQHISNGDRFLYQDSYNQRDVLSTDGTNAGTIVAKHFPSGYAGGMYSLGNKFLVFNILQNSLGEMALWVSSGTGSGNQKLAVFDGRFNITASGVVLGSAGSIVEGGRLYFNFDSVLWHSDGTIDGTYKITYSDTVTTTGFGYIPAIIDFIF